MAALTDNRMSPSKGDIKRVDRYLMANSTTIYAGSLVMINASGLATPATAAVGAKGVVGVAFEKKTSGTGGNDWIQVAVGKFRMGAVSIAQANVGSLMYALDDQTVDETQLANQPVAGTLVEYISGTDGWFLIGPEFNG